MSNEQFQKEYSGSKIHVINPEKPPTPPQPKFISPTKTPEKAKFGESPSKNLNLRGIVSIKSYDHHLTDELPSV